MKPGVFKYNVENNILTGYNINTFFYILFCNSDAIKKSNYRFV